MSLPTLTLTTIALGFSASVDNLPVGFAYGCRRVVIDGVQNLLIAAVTTALTVAAMIFGEQLGHIARPATAHLAGGVALVLLGAWNLAGDVRDEGRDGARPAACPGRARWGELLLLAMSLSLNNLGVGAAAGIAGVPLAAMAAVVFPTSLIFLTLGWALGRRLARRVLSLLPRASIAGDVLLLLVGVVMVASG